MSDSSSDEFDFENPNSEDENTYDDLCSNIVKKRVVKLTKIGSETSGTSAIFIPFSIYEQFKKKLLSLGQLEPIFDENIWPYNFYIDGRDELMLLYWTPDNMPKIPFYRKVYRAFSFLMPTFLAYMNKPFHNPNVLIQVNLLLDYHRAQKRHRDIELFNICDLVAFKMAVDDNRFVYRNCQFHKIISRTLSEYIERGMYMNNGKFDLKKYVGYIQDYRPLLEIFEYLCYNFQKTLKSIRWQNIGAYPIKLSTVNNIPKLMNLWNNNGIVPTLRVTETDESGKCATVLHDILVKAYRLIRIKFELDGEWPYDGNRLYNGTKLLNESLLPKCEITIATPNTLNFIENFINWLKTTFAPSLLNLFILRLQLFESTQPYIFYGFRIRRLEFRQAKLDYKLIRMLKTCKYHKIIIDDCRIENDDSETCGLLRCRLSNDRNIFKYFDELNDVAGLITLKLEPHTAGILFAYIASVMQENNLMDYQLKNMVGIANPRNNLCSFPIKGFRRSGLDANVEQIDAYSSKDKTISIEMFNEFELNEREDFDFYS